MSRLDILNGLGVLFLIIPFGLKLFRDVPINNIFLIIAVVLFLSSQAYEMYEDYRKRGEILRSNIGNSIAFLILLGLIIFRF